MRLFPAVALSDPVVYHHQAQLMESIPIGQDSVESASARALRVVLELQLTRGHSRQMWQQLYTGSYAAFKMMDMAKNRACTQAQEWLEETKVQAKQIIGLEHQVTELHMQHQADQNCIKELEHQLTNAHSKSKVLSQQQEETHSYAVTVREELKETMGFLGHQDQVLEELHRTYPMEFQKA
jgi:Mg2+ and Co2+ transporter CorA